MLLLFAVLSCRVVQVLGRMKQAMVEHSSSASHSFLLDDDSTLPFVANEILAQMDDKVGGGAGCESWRGGRCRLFEGLPLPLCAHAKCDLVVLARCTGCQWFGPAHLMEGMGLAMAIAA